MQGLLWHYALLLRLILPLTRVHVLLLPRSDVLLQHRAEEERAALLRRSEATVLRASAAAAGIADAAVRVARTATLSKFAVA